MLFLPCLVFSEESNVENYDYKKITKITLLDNSKINIETNYYFKFIQDTNISFISTDLFKIKNDSTSVSYISKLNNKDLKAITSKLPDFPEYKIIYLPKNIPDDILIKNKINHWYCSFNVSIDDLDTSGKYKDIVGIPFAVTAPLDKSLLYQLGIETKNYDWEPINPLKTEVLDSIKQENYRGIFYYKKPTDAIVFQKKALLVYKTWEHMITIYPSGDIKSEFTIIADLRNFDKTIPFTYEIPLNLKDLPPSLNVNMKIDGLELPLYQREGFTVLIKEISGSKTEKYGYCILNEDNESYISVVYYNPKLEFMDLYVKTNIYSDQRINKIDPYTISSEYPVLYDNTMKSGDFLIGFTIPDNMIVNEEKLNYPVYSRYVKDSKAVYFLFKDSNKYKEPIKLELYYEFKNLIKVWIFYSNLFLSFLSLILIIITLLNKVNHKSNILGSLTIGFGYIILPIELTLIISYSIFVDSFILIKDSMIFIALPLWAIYTFIMIPYHQNKERKEKQIKQLEHYEKKFDSLKNEINKIFQKIEKLEKK